MVQEKIKNRLLKQKSDLQDLIDRVEKEETIESDAWKFVNEIGDESLENRELLSKQEKLENLNLLLRRVNQALEDIEAVRYGICNRCEEKIEVARLVAYPFSQYCLECQEHIDEKNI